MARIALAVLAVCSLVAMTGCVMVGYSSRGGFFVWPGLGLIGVIFLVLFMLSRRR